MNKLLSTILSITSQKEVESLQQAFLSAVMALYGLHEATICKPVSSAGALKLQQTIKLTNSEQCAKGVLECFDDVPSIIEVNADIQECVNSKKVVINSLAENSVQILFPIVNEGVVLSIVSMIGEKSIETHFDEMNYISGIYGNFFSLINEGERDTLTGLYNRRTFDAKLARMLIVQKSIKHAEMENRALSDQREFKLEECAWLVTIDIDYFKRVNDQFGHVAGDEVLLQLAQKMKESFRSTDLLFRFGGEEFVIILEPIPYDKVWLTLERFRKAIEGHEFPLVGAVTISTGFAGIREQDYPVTILDYADKALYFAKEHGRNCIHSYEKLLETGHLVAPEIEGSIDLF